VSTPAGCALNPAGLSEQRARIEVIRPAVRGVERAPGEVRIRVDKRVDAAAVAGWIETERGCCSFLAIEYGGDRVLQIACEDSAREELLDGFAAVFAGTEATP
jgi:hypothetical protein